MDWSTQHVLKVMLMSVHLIGLLMTGVFILISDNLPFLLFVFVYQALLILHIEWMDGCIISHCEMKIGGNYTLTDLFKRLCWLPPELKMKDCEKIIMITVLGVCLLKIGIVSLPKGFVKDVHTLLRL
jgi:hypothetical protein